MHKRSSWALSVAAFSAAWILQSSAAAFAESGYQTINGTQVYTEIDHASKIATFSNDCGTQKLTQYELQQGAIPSEIIPCPRKSNKNTARTGIKYWGAIAAGISNGPLGLGVLGSKVAVGSSLNYGSESEAGSAALASCRKNGVKTCRVVGAFTGCGYVSVTNGGDRVGWGSGGTSSEAYQNCSQYGNCKTPIGGCNAN